MITVLVCDQDEREYGLISQNCRQQVARNGDEPLQMEHLADNAALADADAILQEQYRVQRLNAEELIGTFEARRWRGSRLIVRDGVEAYLYTAESLEHMLTDCFGKGAL